MTRDRGRRGHSRAHQMRAAALALPALEVPVAGGGGAIAGPEYVRVHPQTHRASRPAPLEPRLGEHPIEAFPLRLELDGDAPGDDERPEAVLHPPAADDVGDDAEILDPGVGARTDEDRVRADVA